MCGVVAREETSKEKNLNIKQELVIFNQIRECGQSWTLQDFWQQNGKKMPLLSRVVREYCVSPASSVGPEASFSVANYINRKERSSLSSRNLRYSMLLREKNTIEKSPI